MDTKWLYFDLEGTLIDTFYAGNLGNIEKARSIIHEERVVQIGIFSFAIYGDRDKDDFRDRLVPKIEDALGVKVVIAPSVCQMMAADFNITGNHFSRMTEWMMVRGKADAFRNWSLSKLKSGCTAISVDDMVTNMEITYSDNNLNIRYINIDQYQP